MARRVLLQRRLHQRLRLLHRLRLAGDVHERVVQDVHLRSRLLADAVDARALRADHERDRLLLHRHQAVLRRRLLHPRLHRTQHFLQRLARMHQHHVARHAHAARVLAAVRLDPLRHVLQPQPRRRLHRHHAVVLGRQRRQLLEHALAHQRHALLRTHHAHLLRRLVAADATARLQRQPLHLQVALVQQARQLLAVELQHLAHQPLQRLAHQRQRLTHLPRIAAHRDLRGADRRQLARHADEHARRTLDGRAHLAAVARQELRLLRRAAQLLRHQHALRQVRQDARLRRLQRARRAPQLHVLRARLDLHAEALLQLARVLAALAHQRADLLHRHLQRRLVVLRVLRAQRLQPRLQRLHLLLGAVQREAVRLRQAAHLHALLLRLLVHRARAQLARVAERLLGHLHHRVLARVRVQQRRQLRHRRLAKTRLAQHPHTSVLLHVDFHLQLLLQLAPRRALHAHQARERQLRRRPQLLHRVLLHPRLDRRRRCRHVLRRAAHAQLLLLEL